MQALALGDSGGDQRPLIKEQRKTVIIAHNRLITQEDPDIEDEQRIDDKRRAA